MAKLLIAALDGQVQHLYRYGLNVGHRVAVLDCFSEFHASLQEQVGDALISCTAHRSDVTNTIQAEQCEMAIVSDGGNLVRAALMIQALRDANVAVIVVITADKKTARIYRRYGAHDVVAARGEEAVSVLEKNRYLQNRDSRSGVGQRIQKRLNSSMKIKLGLEF